MGERNYKPLIITLVVLAVLAAGFAFVFKDFIFGTSSNLPKQSLSKEEKDSMYAEATSADAIDTDTMEVIRMSDLKGNDVKYAEDTEAGSSKVKRVYSGRRINIAVTGVDGRIGAPSKRADANHVISVLLDSGKIEITSIPRDTPADAGFPEGHLQNKLTISRAKGREGYHRELARIAHVDKIHHWVEVGFSQVIGILEFLGYDDPGSTLQVLRSRKALGGDDYQRCYNQGQFIRQMILRHFKKFTGLGGDIILRGGLAIVDTDLDMETINMIISSLEKSGFPQNYEDVFVKVRPPINIKYKQYDFTDFSTMQGLSGKIEKINDKKGMADDAKRDAKAILEKAIAKAVKDSSKSPIAVIGGLDRFFEQRAWFQVKEANVRAQIRDQVCILLINAYIKKGNTEKAQKVSVALQNERELFNSGVSKKFKKGN
jgi:anionic cell wall polymer biosynthesis LytR-Cps2A-Psr (LCP) family protein